MQTSYGLPLRCEGECATRYLVPSPAPGTWFRVELVSHYWLLKTPGVKSQPCPNCGAKLTAQRKRRRGS